MPSEGRPPEFNLLYFAGAATFTKKPQERLPAPLEISKLFGLLEQLYAGITRQVLNSCLVTVNQEYVDVSDQGDSEQAPVIIQNGDEVAIIPPVSSG